MQMITIFPETSHIHDILFSIIKVMHDTLTQMVSSSVLLLQLFQCIQDANYERAENLLTNAKYSLCKNDIYIDNNIQAITYRVLYDILKKSSRQIDNIKKNIDVFSKDADDAMQYHSSPYVSYKIVFSQSQHLIDAIDQMYHKISAILALEFKEYTRANAHLFFGYREACQSALYYTCDLYSLLNVSIDDTSESSFIY